MWDRPLPFLLEQAGVVEDAVDVRGCGSCGDCETGEETDAFEHGDGTGGDGETERHCQDESGDERDDSLNDSAHVENPFYLLILSTPPILNQSPDKSYIQTEQPQIQHKMREGRTRHHAPPACLLSSDETHETRRPASCLLAATRGDDNNAKERTRQYGNEGKARTDGAIADEMGGGDARRLLANSSTPAPPTPGGGGFV